MTNAKKSAVAVVLRLWDSDKKKTQQPVWQAIPLGQNTNDLMLAFGIKETECLKASGSDPQTCAFRSGFFVVRDSISSGIRIYFIFR